MMTHYDQAINMSHWPFSPLIEMGHKPRFLIFVYRDIELEHLSSGELVVVLSPVGFIVNNCK